MMHKHNHHHGRKKKGMVGAMSAPMVDFAKGFEVGAEIAKKSNKKGLKQVFG